jgi:hypothetical protein
MAYHVNERVCIGRKKPDGIGIVDRCGSKGIQEALEKPPEHPVDDMPRPPVLRLIGEYKGNLLHSSV